MNPAYFDQISHAFLEGSGRGLVLSPRDQLLVAGWAREGVPAKVVVDGITKAFTGEVQGRTRSMAYVVPAVEECIALWRSKNVGQAIENIDIASDLSRSLDHLMVQLSSAAEAQETEECAAAVTEAARSVEDLKPSAADHEGLSATLKKIEATLCARLMDVLEADVQMEIERSVEKALAGMSFSSHAIRAQTRMALTRKRLRNRCGLPPFEIDLAGGW